MISLFAKCSAWRPFGGCRLHFHVCLFNSLLVGFDLLNAIIIYIICCLFLHFAWEITFTTNHIAAEVAAVAAVAKTKQDFTHAPPVIPCVIIWYVGERKWEFLRTQIYDCHHFISNFEFRNEQGRMKEKNATNKIPYINTLNTLWNCLLFIFIFLRALVCARINIFYVCRYLFEMVNVIGMAGVQNKWQLMNLV